MFYLRNTKYYTNSEDDGGDGEGKLTCPKPHSESASRCTMPDPQPNT